MHMRFPTAAVALASLAALAACGGSSGSSSSSSSSGNGSGFCDQAQQVSTDLTGLSAAFAASASGTSTPDPGAFKQLMQQGAQDLDNLDSQAPSDIATAFHHLRTVFDQVNQQIQSAGSFDDMQSPLAALSDSSVQTDETTVNNYMTNTCHITPAASASPT